MLEDEDGEKGCCVREDSRLGNERSILLQMSLWKCRSFNLDTCRRRAACWLRWGKIIHADAGGRSVRRPHGLIVIALPWDMRLGRFFDYILHIIASGSP